MTASFGSGLHVIDKILFLAPWAHGRKHLARVANDCGTGHYSFEIEGLLFAFNKFEEIANALRGTFCNQTVDDPVRHLDSPLLNKAMSWAARVGESRFYRQCWNIRLGPFGSGPVL